MGLPFNLYFALLAIGQFGTLTLVAVNYWEHQNLRVQIDSIAKGSIEHRESGLKVARKPDYPGDPDSSGAIERDQSHLRNRRLTWLVVLRQQQILTVWGGSPSQFCWGFYCLFWLADFCGNSGNLVILVQLQLDHR